MVYTYLEAEFLRAVDVWYVTLKNCVWDVLIC
jgi:hypothetical protein